jgi:RHS repeat-associated protein
MTAVVGARNFAIADAGVVFALLQARYYDGSKGEFLSEDPVFLGDPKQQVLTDPQSLNSYSYANDNPITGSDPTGLAATKAQQIAVLKAQVTILTGIIGLYQSGNSQSANSAFSAYQTAFGSGAQWTGSFATTRPGSFGGSIQMPNITQSLNTQMRSNAADSGKNDPLYFALKVKNGGDWDLKNTATYNSSKYPMGFAFDGQLVSKDTPGNINYGYVGASTWWATPQLLLKSAGVAQVLAGTSQPQWQNSSFRGDDPVDQVNILWGANMYYNR